MLLCTLCTNSNIKIHSSLVEGSAVYVRIWRYQRGCAHWCVGCVLDNAFLFGVGVGLYQQNR